MRILPYYDFGIGEGLFQISQGLYVIALATENIKTNGKCSG